MLALRAVPVSQNVLQENQSSLTNQSTWSVNLPNGVSTGDALIALVATGASVGTGPGYEVTQLVGGG